MKDMRMFSDNSGKNFFIVDEDDYIIAAKMVDCDTPTLILADKKVLTANYSKNQYKLNDKDISKEKYQKLESKYINELDSMYDRRYLYQTGNFSWLMGYFIKFLSSWIRNL